MYNQSKPIGYMINSVKIDCFVVILYFFPYQLQKKASTVTLMR